VDHPGGESLLPPPDAAEAGVDLDALVIVRAQEPAVMKAADRALARLAAELGPDAVVRATLRQGHLPEARFALEPIRHVRPPGIEKETASRREEDSIRPKAAAGTLIRRIFTRPRPLQKKPVVGPRGCHLKGMSNAPATRVTGPYIVSGGWWVREVHREDDFAETESGKILWVYYDKRRRSWFLHGEVL
jgi:protein ImuB